MRCKTCDYPLWNLKARQCPECGSPFLPGEFEFIINSVRFCCPQPGCDQSYYGTGDKGHLVPQEFNCVACGIRISMNEMVLRPAEGIDERQTKAENMPWLERQQRGAVKAWFATVGKAMVMPGRLMLALPENGGSWPAFWFAVITSLLIGLACAVPRVFFVFLMLSSMGAGRPGAMWPMVSLFCMVALLMIVMPPLLIGLLGCVVHGILRLTGDTAFRMHRTYQALWYSIGANVPSAVPCVGAYFGWIWWVVSAILMVKEGQQVGGFRASLAVIVSALLGLVIWIAAFFVSVGLFVGMRGAAQFANVSPYSETVMMTQMLAIHLQVNRSRPAHALELLSSGSTTGVNSFVSTSTRTDQAKIPIAGTTLDKIDFLPPGRQQQAAQSEGAALPQGTIAHRLGDFVFTYHGIGANPPDPNLWIVMYSPDPDFNSAAGVTRVITVGLANGTVATPAGPMSAALAQQNALRAQYNLPPLPDPATVTHAKPAIAPVAGNP